MKQQSQLATQIVITLQANGFKAVLAGGCVRDSFLNLVSEDYDIATDATPDEIEALFPHTIPVGKSFGVVVVVLEGIEFEVATFRSDGTYSDGRRPDTITFTTMEEDAKRRDFTINGLFHDPVTAITYDFVGGMVDLKNRVLRFIGNPHERIEEDKLRMLRFIRFALRFALSMDAASCGAINKHATDIKQISAERIGEELVKIFTGPSPDKALELLHESGLLQEVLPEVAALKGLEQGEKYHPEGNVFEHTKLVMKAVAPSMIRRFGALLHDVGKPSAFRMRDGKHTFYGHETLGADIADHILKRLKFSNEDRAAVVYLVRNHMRFFNIERMKTAKIKKLFREPLYFDLQELHKADVEGSNKDLSTYYVAVERYAELCATLAPPKLLTGYDLLALGLKQGPHFKTILSKVEDLQLENILNTKEEALAYVQQTFLMMKGESNGNS